MNNQSVEAIMSFYEANIADYVEDGGLQPPPPVKAKVLEIVTYLVERTNDVVIIPFHSDTSNGNIVIDSKTNKRRLSILLRPDGTFRLSRSCGDRNPSGHDFVELSEIDVDIEWLMGS